MLAATLSLWPLLSFASEKNGCKTNVTVEQLGQGKHGYYKKILCVTKILHVEFEGSDLRFGKAKAQLTYEGPKYTNKSIDRGEKRMKGWMQKFQDQCVVVRARFQLKETGHFGM